MPQIHLRLIPGAPHIGEPESQYIEVDDLDAAQERARLLITHFYSQGVAISSSASVSSIDVEVNGLFVPYDDLWEDLRSTVAGRPRVV